MAGDSTLASGAERATVWNPASGLCGYTPADLGMLNSSTDSYATGINAAGQVTGHSGTGALLATGNYHAFRTSPNAPINPATDDLGSLGGGTSYGWAIDEVGHVAGESTWAAPWPQGSTEMHCISFPAGRSHQAG